MGRGSGARKGSGTSVSTSACECEVKLKLCRRKVARQDERLQKKDATIETMREALREQTAASCDSLVAMREQTKSLRAAKAARQAGEESLVMHVITRAFHLLFPVFLLSDCCHHNLCGNGGTHVTFAEVCNPCSLPSFVRSQKRLRLEMRKLKRRQADLEDKARCLDSEGTIRGARRHAAALATAERLRREHEELKQECKELRAMLGALRFSFEVCMHHGFMQQKAHMKNFGMHTHTQ